MNDFEKSQNNYTNNIKSEDSISKKYQELDDVKKKGIEEKKSKPIEGTKEVSSFSLASVEKKRTSKKEE